MSKRRANREREKRQNNKEREREKRRSSKDTIQIIINSFLKGIRQRRLVSPLFSISLGGLRNATLFDASSSFNQKTSGEDEEGVFLPALDVYIYIFIGENAY